MKKKLLAIGVAASLGIFAGAASANPTVNAGGIGHTNIIPYFSTQNGNATLISITNTDQTNGKAVKVRFRGAEWSDDIFDFQVFLSPGDVFTGAVTSANGLSKFATADKTCTLPASVNQNFVPIRLQNTATGTLEGYIEIITMADIPPTLPDTTANPLYTAIKHVNGVAPCTSATASARLENLVQDNWVNVAAAPQSTYMTTPATLAAGGGSLTSYATIINVPSSKAFANVATAINYDAPRKAYFRQANVGIAATNQLTADRIFFAKGAEGGAAVPSYQFDLPDLSSPVEAANGTATAQRNALTAALQKSSVVAEYSTLDILAAATDIVISQPTRRYFYNYTESATGNFTLEGVKYTVAGDAGSPYSTLNGVSNRVDLVGTVAFYDREENKAGSNIVISPTPPGGALSLKGEVSVIGINNGSGATGALGALLTINDITATGAGGTVYEEGWAILPTIAGYSAAGAPTVYENGTADGRLPVIGFTANNVFNGAVASGTNYGTTLPLRYLNVAP